jgi:hypothetical protein
VDDASILVKFTWRRCQPRREAEYRRLRESIPAWPPGRAGG